MKNLSRFSKALSTKIQWQILSTKNIWMEVVTEEYIHPPWIDD